MVDGAQFPVGTYYSVLWGLEVQHGGMTNAGLHRSRLISAATGKPVTVVTYNYQEDLAEVIATLRERGKLTDLTPVINMWEDILSWDDEQLGRIREVGDTSGEYFSPLPVPDGGPAPRYAETFRDDGEFLQRDYRRADGTLAVSHRRFVKPDGTGVNVTVCDRAGNPVGSLPAARQFYRFWLDSLPRDPTAFFVIDSKTAANHYPDYRRPNTRTIYMVHGSHLADGENSPLGQLSGGRRYTIENMRNFDGVVVLTESQRDDLETAYGDTGNLYVCPNSRDAALLNSSSDIDDRPTKRGVMVGNLVAGKRFSHGIRVVSGLRKKLKFVKLDIFGEGDRRPLLESSIAKHKVTGQVRLAGYTNDVLAELRNASFLLMTSNREGFGLVLVEAMSQGCIPVSYDIRYGPSDIITDGVDGFLVESDNVPAMAGAVIKILKMNKSERRAMREAAVKRAADFSDQSVVDRWADILSSVAAAPGADA